MLTTATPHCTAGKLALAYFVTTKASCRRGATAKRAATQAEDFPKFEGVDDTCVSGYSSLDRREASSPIPPRTSPEHEDDCCVIGLSLTANSAG